MYVTKVYDIEKTIWPNLEEKNNKKKRGKEEVTNSDDGIWNPTAINVVPKYNIYKRKKTQRLKDSSGVVVGH